MAQRKKTSIKPKASSPKKLHPQYILLVEDEPAHAAAIRHAIRSANPNVVVKVAGSLQEYRSATATSLPDIVLIDINLPDGKAFDVLTPPPEAGSFPIVVMTSYSDEKKAVKAIKEGALDYVVKSPDAFKEIPRTLERALREWKLIQESKRAEELLRESEKKYKAVIEGAAEGILIADLETKKFKYANPLICSMLGYSPNELVGLSVNDIHPPEHLPEVIAGFESIARGEITLSYRIPCLRKDGTILFAEINTTRIIFEGTLCNVGFFTDITERMRVEEELKESERRFHTLIENSDDVFSLVDPKGQILYRSPSASRILGIPDEEIVNTNMLERIWPSDLKDVKHTFDQMLQAPRKPIAFQTRVKNKDGLPLWIEGVGTNLITDPVVHAVVINYRNITERKRMEEEIKFEKEELQILNNIILKIIEVTDLKSRLEYIMDESLKVVDLEGGTICLLNRDDTFNLAVHRETSEETINDLSLHNIKIGECLCGNCAKECKPLILNTREEVLNFATREVLRGEDIRFHAAFPFVIQGECVGVLCVFTRTDKKPTSHSLNLLKTIVAQTAVSIENADLFDDVRESEVRYRALVESSPDAITQSDLSGKILMCNLQTALLLGYERLEDLIGTSVFDLFPLEELERARVNLQKTLKEGVIRNTEYRLLKKDGSQFQVELSATVIPDAEGKPASFMAMTRDITERRRAEEALRDSEKRLSELNILQGILLQPNPIEQKLKLITENIVRVIGADFARIWMIKPGDRCEAGCIHAQVVDGPHACRFRDRCLHLMSSSGRYTHIDGRDHGRVPFGCYKIGKIAAGEGTRFLTNEVTTDPRVHNHTWAKEMGLVSFADYRLVDIDGTPIGVLALFSKQAISVKEDLFLQGIANVTSHVLQAARTEEALRNSEEKFRKAFMTSPDAVTINRLKDGVYVSINQGFTRIMEYTEEDILKKTSIETNIWVDPSDRNKLVEGLKKDGIVENFVARFRSKTGEIKYGMISASIIELDGIQHILGIVRDITERNLIEEQLRQMQKLEGLGTLAGGIAHDFNNILGIILAYNTSIERSKGDAKKLDLATEIIAKTVQRGKTLVQQVLTFARKSATEFGPVDVNDIVKDISGMIFEMFPKNITQALNFNKSISFINADRSQLNQALLNLCVNARDAMPSGGVLTISTHIISVANLRNQHPDAAASSYVCIEVSDTGEGMTEEIRKRIFEPFFTTKGIGKGTGLGLSVVFGVVQTHKGFIDVESELGKGTTFRLYLPVSQAIESVIEKEEETLEEIPGGTETLLVVEDEETLLLFLQTALVDKGYKVLSAKDGLTALRIYQERKNDISLVLTDLGLPSMTGLEVCQRIKKIDPKEHMILATGFLDPDMKSEFLKAGIQHFLYKPYDFKKVLKVVREVLDAK